MRSVRAPGRAVQSAAMTRWEPVVGVEIHARLLTGSKIFCGCATRFGAAPNTQVCPVCLGYPGALPVVNRAAIELAIRMALATGCTIHEQSVFARKNYFYPDLPKGFQISQFDRPLASGGTIHVGSKAIRIRRIHLEEDAGKLLHRSGDSLVDLNRAGTPLIEIVSEPDLSSGEEAAAFSARIRQLLMYTDVCDGNMEEGSLRCDANVSVRRAGAELGTRAEVKNVNSFRFVARAIEYEIERQTALLESGGEVVQETRLFDPAANETRPMRSKEEAHDYRYFPEPDLFTLRVEREWIERIRSAVPELPDARSRRYQAEWSIPAIDAEALVVERQLADYFEAVAAASGHPRQAANWVRNEVLRVLNDARITIGEYRVTPEMLGRLIAMVADGTIGGKSAKEVFDEMSSGGETPDAIVARRGLAQVTDVPAIRSAAMRVIERSAAQVAQYRAGKTQLFGYFVGQVMKESGGTAKAEIVNEVLRELLG